MKEVVDAFLQENEWALDYWQHMGKYCVLCPATGGEILRMGIQNAVFRKNVQHVPYLFPFAKFMTFFL